MNSIVRQGMILRGKYCLLEELGHGSGGRVFLAVDIGLKKRWAVKVFGDTGLQRQEISLLTSLEHPMIPRIVEYIEEDELICVVMDYLEGVDLAALQRSGRVFSRDEILRFGIAVCDVLAYLHGRYPPVIYRDLKPHNLMLQKNGTLKLVDFGSACCVSPDGERDEIPSGTKGYAAPEQFGGKSDARTDLYAFGVTFQVLYGGKDRRLRAVLKRCRKRKPQHRYQSAEKLKSRLEQLQAVKKTSFRMKKLAAAAVIILISLSLLRYIVRLGSETAYQEAMLCKDYRTAAELYPEREEVYEKSLEDGVQKGETLSALRQVSSLRRIYPEETSSHKRILLKMGMLWFQGNPLDPAFTPDYEQAAACLSQVPEGEFPEADSRRKILHVLYRDGNEVNWESAAEALKAMELEGAGLTNMQRIQQLELMASVWVANRYYFQKAGALPLKDAARLLEEALELSVDTPDRENVTGIKTALAQVYYVNGMLSGDEALLRKWIKVYETLQGEALPEMLRRQICQRAAYVYEELEAYKDAEACYRQLIAADPDNAGYYCEYALMELLKRQDVKKAVRLFQSAGELPEAKENRNYQILKERLEGAP